MNDLEIIVNLTDEQYAAIQRGEKVTLTIDSNPNQSVPTFKQWEPKGGKYRIYGDGTIEVWGDTDCSKGYQSNGHTRETEEQAIKAADKMQRFNRLLAYVDEFDSEYEPDWNLLQDDKYSIIYHHGEGVYKMFSNHHVQNISAVYMSKKAAEELVRKLNTKEVVL